MQKKGGSTMAASLLYFSLWSRRTAQGYEKEEVL